MIALFIFIIACGNNSKEKKAIVDVSVLQNKSAQLGWKFDVEGPPYDDQELQEFALRVERAENLSLQPPQKIFGPVSSKNVLIYDQLFNVALIPNGSLWVGDGKQRHEIQITHDLYVMREELSQATYKKFTGRNPSAIQNLNSSVNQITWLKAVKFANSISERSGLERCYIINNDDVRWVRGYKCNGWRLPTEMEWDYVAQNSNPSEVKDMIGGMAEWTWDWFFLEDDPDDIRKLLPHERNTCRKKCCKIQHFYDSIPEERFDKVGVRYFRSK
jgi:hypothetical protein